MRTTVAPGSVREVPIPLPGGEWPVLRATFPMSEEAWKQMLVVLEAMRSGLVVKNPDAQVVS